MVKIETLHFGTGDRKIKYIVLILQHFELHVLIESNRVFILGINHYGIHANTGLNYSFNGVVN